MGKKQRLKERDERRKERHENNLKRDNYHHMAEKGELGARDLEKYSFMYETIKNEERLSFIKPDNNPTREDYNKLKNFYYSSRSSLDKILH